MSGTLLICEPHRDSPFEPYRLVRVVSQTPSTFDVQTVGDKREQIDGCPRGWFTLFDQTYTPAGLHTPMQKAQYELSRSHGQTAIRYAAKTYGKDTPDYRSYLVRLLRDRGVDAGVFTDADWTELFGRLRYNGRD